MCGKGNNKMYKYYDYNNIKVGACVNKENDYEESGDNENKSNSSNSIQYL